MKFENFEILTADKVKSEKIALLFSQAFGERKSDFLIQHGSWLHKSDDNRFVIVQNGNPVGYCGIIPTKIAVNGKIHDIVWWNDLWIHPDFRGRGLEKLFDKKITEFKEIKLGFPNKIAATIHKKHGWFVRENLRTRFLPVFPLRLPKIMRSTGIWKIIYFLLAGALNPFQMIIREKYRNFKPLFSWKISHPNVEQFATIFQKNLDRNTVTVFKDTDFFRWRYWECPYFDELSFYFCGDRENPTHYLITRILRKNGQKIGRILDMDGNLNAPENFVDMIKHATRDFIKKDVVQISAMATTEEIDRIFRKSNFYFFLKSRFCCKTSNGAILSPMKNRIRFHFADSDNDIS